MDVTILFSVLLFANIAMVQGVKTYRAAVYEHTVILPKSPAIDRHMALKQMMHNLGFYAVKARKAGMKVNNVYNE